MLVILKSCQEWGKKSAKARERIISLPLHARVHKLLKGSQIWRRASSKGGGRRETSIKVKKKIAAVKIKNMAFLALRRENIFSWFFVQSFFLNCSSAASGHRLLPAWKRQQRQMYHPHKYTSGHPFSSLTAPNVSPALVRPFTPDVHFCSEEVYSRRLNVGALKKLTLPSAFCGGWGGDV
jgi:hypothetical protein